MTLGDGSSEYSATAPLEASSLLDDVPHCAWCGGIIPAVSATGRRKRPSRFCGKRCRQASWRFGQEGPDFAGDAGRPRRFAYADPPYPGMSRRHYSDHPEYGGEVDHDQLIASLLADYPDGWALSTSPRSTLFVAGLLEQRGLRWWRDYRVGIWTKPAPPGKTRRAKSAYEPVFFCGGRQRPDDAPHLVDWVHAAQPRDWPASGVGRVAGRVTGIKPAAFSVWVFRTLGALAGDELVDLYPGSGAVSEAWRRYVGQDLADASLEDPDDAMAVA